MKTTHTALPWHTNLRSHPSDQVFSDDLIVADCKWTNHAPDVREANSEFIVHACNSHYEMLAALERLLSAFSSARGLAVKEPIASTPVVMELRLLAERYTPRRPR